VAQKLTHMSLNELSKLLKGQLKSVISNHSITLNLNGNDIVNVGSLYINDDEKLYFGNDSDASIEYNEDGNDKLIISGSAAGIEVTGSMYISGSVYANEYVIDTITTTVTNIEQRGSTKFGDSSDDTHQFSGSLYVADDAKIYFGGNQDASIEYDENGTDELRLAGAAITFEQDATFDNDVTLGVAATDVTTVTGRLTASQGMLISDDKKIYFGTSEDAFIEYDDTSDNHLVISGSSNGIAMSGSNIAFDGNVQVKNDYHTTAFESQLSDGDMGSGEILYYEPGADTTLTKGGIYFLHTDGTWDEADADAATTAKQLLGIALGTSARTHGMLIRGFVKIPSTEVLNVPGSGASDGLPVYISTTAAHLDFTAPSASGDIVRVVGYCVDDDSSDILLLFRPDNTWVEIA